MNQHGTGDDGRYAALQPARRADADDLSQEQSEIKDARRGVPIARRGDSVGRGIARVDVNSFSRWCYKSERGA